MWEAIATLLVGGITLAVLIVMDRALSSAPKIPDLVLGAAQPAPKEEDVYEVFTDPEDRMAITATCPAQAAERYAEEWLEMSFDTPPVEVFVQSEPGAQAEGFLVRLALKQLPGPHVFSEVYMVAEPAPERTTERPLVDLHLDDAVDLTEHVRAIGVRRLAS